MLFHPTPLHISKFMKPPIFTSYDIANQLCWFAEYNSVQSKPFRCTHPIFYLWCKFHFICSPYGRPYMVRTPCI